MDSALELVRELIDKLKTKESEIDLEFLEDFIEEAKEHLEEIEINLLSLETNPEDEEIINNIFRHFHTIKGLAGFVEQDLIRHIAHNTENLLDDCRKGKIKVNKRVVNVILEATDIIKGCCKGVDTIDNEEFIKTTVRLLEEIDGVGTYEDDEEEIDEPKKIGEILIENKSITDEDLEDILNIQREKTPSLKIGEIALKEKKVEPKKIIDAIRSQNKGKSDQQANSSYIKIPTYKVDSLVDMLGELIITQSLAEQEAIERLDSNDSLINKLLRISRITKSIQNISMSLRMIDLKSTFQKINRVVRDTIQGSHKEVSFKTYGEETEIDRNIAEKLLEPLLHLVKNSIAHGIEKKEERISKGKSPEGIVEILAYSKRGTVFIEVRDDGKGISLEKVYKKALEKGLVEKDKEYTEKEIIDFILLPGFSTKEKVDSNSGRGVGMDVVKTEIEKVGGRIEIQNYPDKGCSFILKIPINLAIMNGTVIEINSSKYIIPTLSIKEIFEIKKENWVSIKGKKRMLRIRDNIIPIIPLDQILDTSKENSEEKRIAIVLENDNVQKGIIVSNIIERREIVAKPLGNEFKSLKFISGVSILGDGRIYLILDIQNLFDLEGVI